MEGPPDRSVEPVLKGPTRGARGLLRLWFSTDVPVDRWAYVASALGLGLFKFALDSVAVRVVVGKPLPLLFYFFPMLAQRLDALSPAPEWLLWAMAAWTVPFLWISLSMTVRRASDAGLSPWLGFLVLLPVLNFAVALVLMLVPSGRRTVTGTRAETDVRDPTSAALRAALASTVLGVSAGLGMVALSTLVFGAYGSALFVATPVLLGAVCSYVQNARVMQSTFATLGVVTLSVILVGLGLLAFGIEGGICLVMAAPVVAVPAVIGALIGRAIAAAGHARRIGAQERVFRISLLVLALPCLAALERPLAGSPRYEVVTSLEIDAPPEAVWPNVIGFSELPEPDALLFRLGVAHPRRAWIEGEGRGAVRHCEFSTGAFVEPITAWEPPRRLAFDVTAQPPPMHEWSPYKNIHPPHLDGSIRSRGGEFRLVALPDGRTRLEGSTWYELDLFPQVYFHAWSDALVHRIHRQVLEHVKRLSERRGQTVR